MRLLEPGAGGHPEANVQDILICRGKVLIAAEKSKYAAAIKVSGHVPIRLIGSHFRLAIDARA
jgi:hypothetical protein